MHLIDGTMVLHVLVQITLCRVLPSASEALVLFLAGVHDNVPVEEGLARKVLATVRAVCAY